ncbi:hypothetical protein AJ79_05450 [Helicocarpus griseus UAMH5409]|uniref:DUF7730 domain-containing protein n=1 Tax=Helicocarpus griseus UAMH5409 TaxID=1447875 RepID=A0A2B7XPF6_9EURO|nr:hypothetical protein AJ79_05450 [Helicocarpus griseus UAMH5409]
MRKLLENLSSAKLSFRRQRQKNALPTNPNLTPSPDNHDNGFDNDSQPPFPFLSLPPEIRNQIYFALFNCDRAVHLFHAKDKLHLIRCRQPTPALDDSCCPHTSLAHHCIQNLNKIFAELPPEHQQHDSPRKPNNIINNAKKTSWSTPSHLPTDILYTNKQLYNEASAVLYSDLYFEAAELKTWLLFAHMVSARHLALVKRLRSTWVGLPCLTMAPVRPGGAGYAAYEQYTLWDEPYEEFWEIVRCRMDGLVELGFCMNYEGQYLDRSTGARWLEPLLRVRGLKWVEVWVRDRIGGEDGRGGEDAEGARREGEAFGVFLRGVMCSGRRGEAVGTEVAGEGGGGGNG